MPLRSIPVPWNRLATVSAATLKGTSGAAHFLRNNFIDGDIYGPIPLPEDFDVSRPSYVRVPLGTPATDTNGPYFVRLVLSVNAWFPLGGNNATAIGLDWPCPSPTWSISDVPHALIDRGDGSTLLPGFFQPGSVVGFWLQRDGLHAADTWPLSVQALDTLLLTFHRRCQLL